MHETRTQVALVGFMGTGKTTVGALLAARLGFVFADLDRLLVALCGRTIPEIFAREGEAGFRLREQRLLAEISGQPRQVLATGGGIVLLPANVEVLRASGLVVALTASLPMILARVGSGSGRPLLSGPGVAERLLSEREHLYRQAADLVVDTTNLTPDEAAGQVAGWCSSIRWEARS